MENHVTEGYKGKGLIILKRAAQAIQLVENIHKLYEPSVDVLKGKRGTTAAFVVYARVISLLNSIVYLLRGGVPAESFLLFRPLFEAILLAQYFFLSQYFNENHDVINRWFTKDRSPKASTTRKYIIDKAGEEGKEFDELYGLYSKPIHHTYRSIMESSYRGYRVAGFSGEVVIRKGFDYHESSIGRDIVTISQAFERILLHALIGFKMCFEQPLELSPAELNDIKSEILFYTQPQDQRLAMLFTQNDDE